MKIRFIDLFCGIGGFRIAAQNAFGRLGATTECLFSSDIDPSAQTAYEANFGERPFGDITKAPTRAIPKHDILFAGFPCQPFSIIGKQRGFEDARGTLFFEIARIIDAKKPAAFVLENVKRLSAHDDGRTLDKIMKTLAELGYWADWRVLNALDYGLPQKRERTIIVGFRRPIDYRWPDKIPQYKPLADILERDVDAKYYVSDNIRQKRLAAHTPKTSPSIWHENKAGNISSYPYSCALRAGASYNYLLVDGKRRLTPREMLRLQGFPDSYKIVVSDSQARRQAGNAVPVNLVEAVLNNLAPFIISELKNS